METSMAAIDFAACKLFTDAAVIPNDPRISVVPIPRLTSGAAYSQFVLSKLVNHLHTSHCMIVQWDGHVLDPSRWQPEFLDYDYIGASWPQFDDGHDVGNGGFSLRSRRLLEACRLPDFQASHPEDVAIGRQNRAWLEEQGIYFAPRAVADAFSTERAGVLGHAFGYHGVWHMPRAMGVEDFWQTYTTLDNRDTFGRDFVNIIAAVVRNRFGGRRVSKMIVDAARNRLSRYFY